MSGYDPGYEICGLCGKTGLFHAKTYEMEDATPLPPYDDDIVLLRDSCADLFTCVGCVKQIRLFKKTATVADEKKIKAATTTKEMLEIVQEVVDNLKESTAKSIANAFKAPKETKVAVHERYAEYIGKTPAGGTSSKFYRIVWNDDSCKWYANWGKIHTKGTYKEHQTPTPGAAKKAAERKFKGQLKKGYIEKNPPTEIEAPPVLPPIPPAPATLPNVAWPYKPKPITAAPISTGPGNKKNKKPEKPKIEKLGSVGKRKFAKPAEDNE